MGVKNMIRKTVGWCWNHAYIYNDVLFTNPECSVAKGWPANYLTTPFRQPVLNRIISSWLNTRETFVALCAKFQRGPDLTSNAHLWPQGGMRHTFDLTNVTNGKTRYQLYWCTVKCNKRFPTPGVFRANYVTPFTTGSAASFPPWASDTDRPFDQSSRQPQTGDTPLIQSFIESGHALNIVTAEGLGAPTTVYRAPVPSAVSEQLYGAGAYSVWESITTTESAIPDADIIYRERLTWTFPFLKHRLNVKLVSAGTIRANGTKTFRVTTKMPKELRPEQLRSDNGPDLFEDVSGFFYLKAVSEPLTTRIPAGGQGNLTQAPSDYGAAVQVPIFEQFSRFPVALRARVIQEYAVRSAFDGQPTFIQLYGGSPLSPPGVNDKYLVTNQGFLNDGYELALDGAQAALTAPTLHPWSGPTGPVGIATAGSVSIIS